MYQIGLFQGCPLSVVLFLILFNLKDQTRSWVPVEEHRLQTVSESLCRSTTWQLIIMKCWWLQRTSQSGWNFLKWTRTMEAKPTKCRSLAMKKLYIVRANERPTHHMIHSLKKVEKRSHLSTNRLWGFMVKKYSRTLVIKKKIRYGVEPKLKDLLVRVDQDSVNSINYGYMKTTLWAGYHGNSSFTASPSHLLITSKQWPPGISNDEK